MPAHKINPKILTTNLADDGPMPGATHKIAQPSSTIQATVMGPISVLDDNLPHMITTFVLPAELLDESGVYIHVNYTAVLLGAGTTIQVSAADATGLWENGGSDITPSAGVGLDGWMSIYLDLGNVTGQGPNLPRGQVTLTVTGYNAIGNTLTINEVDLCYDTYAAIGVVP